ncbi:MAG: C25 family cysteine peptidase, partial [Desulfocucumaceae bacterium]
KAGSAIPVKRRSPLAQSLVMNQIKAAIANKDDFVRLTMTSTIKFNEASAKSPATESPSLEGSTVDYVIITSEELAPQFQRLADWKTQKGIYTIVKTTRWIESNYRGADLQEKIRRFIQDAWVNWGTVLVLLGGDTPVIPAR